MKRKRQSLLQILLCFVILSTFLLPAYAVSANGLCGMYTEVDDISRGSSFKLFLTATNAQAGVEGVQLYVKYDSQCFQFVKANSVLLETPGTEIAEGTDLKPRTLNDDGNIITILAMAPTYTPSNNVVAVLEFVCKVDAVIGPGSFQYVDNSFVAVTGVGKVPAATDKLVVNVIDNNVAAHGQEQPYEPAPPPPETTPSSIDVPYNPSNQINPVASDPNKQPSDYGVGVINGDVPTTTPATTGTKPTMPSFSSETTPATTAESPLRAESGEVLYVPEGGLPIDKIPQGFQGGTESIQNVNVPLAKSAEKNLTLYWLKASGEPSFFTYDTNTQRFKYYDMKQLNTESATTASQKAMMKKVEGDNTWMILVLSLLSLSSLSIMIFTLHRNLKS